MSISFVVCPNCATTPYEISYEGAREVMCNHCYHVYDEYDEGAWWLEGTNMWSFWTRRLA